MLRMGVRSILLWIKSYGKSHGKSYGFLTFTGRIGKIENSLLCHKEMKGKEDHG